MVISRKQLNDLKEEFIDEAVKHDDTADSEKTEAFVNFVCLAFIQFYIDAFKENDIDYEALLFLLIKNEENIDNCFIGEMKEVVKKLTIGYFEKIVNEYFPLNSFQVEKIEDLED